MILWRVLIVCSLVLHSAFSVGASCDLFMAVISQNSQHDLSQSNILCDSIEEQTSKQDALSLKCVRIPESIQGYWALWPAFSWVLENHSCRWVLFTTSDSAVNLANLATFLEGKNSSYAKYYGYGLRDDSFTIIHHFYGYDKPKGAKSLEYPDFAAGVLMPRKLIERSANFLNKNPFKQQFSIDAQHELARFLFEEFDAVMESQPQIFCSFATYDTCGVTYQSAWSETKETKSAKIESLFVAIKTFSGFHRTRLVVMKRTWTRDLPHIEYVSDVADKYVPTIASGVVNTERGHCGKTFTIMQRFLENTNDLEWLLIADDDTLLSVPRLLRLLGLYNRQDMIIIGERYGFGFSAIGDSGYDYPTGGAGMVFSRKAVESLLASCSCPKDDSPDDMIIGMCARSIGIPVLHSPAFHQARVKDYAADYIRKIPPISFHKFEDTDPYKDFMDYLDEDYKYWVLMTNDNNDHSEL